MVRDIEMRNVTSRKSKYGLYLRAFQNAPIEGVSIVDCHFNDVASGNVLENARGVTFTRSTMNGKAL